MDDELSKEYTAKVYETLYKADKTIIVEERLLVPLGSIFRLDNFFSMSVGCAC